MGQLMNARVCFQPQRAGYPGLTLSTLREKRPRGLAGFGASALPATHRRHRIVALVGGIK